MKYPARMAARFGLVLFGLMLLAGQPARRAAGRVESPRVESLTSKVPTPAAFVGHEIGADGELARYPKVLEYFQHAREADRSRQVRGDRQDDDGASVRAGDDQLAGEPEAVATAGRDQPAAGRSARAERRRGGDARGGGAAVLPALRDDPLDRSGERAGDPADRAQAGDRNEPGGAGDPRQRGPPAGAVAESRRPARWCIDHWYKTKGTQLRTACIRTSTTSMPATTTTATGSCSRRRKRG